jgi:uncharacterized delta-60 repeat protein
MKRAINILFSFLVTFISINIYSQPAPPIDWVRDNISGQSKDMVIDNSGNIYVTGVTYAGSSNDFCTIKYNSSGIQQWTVTFNGSANLGDEASSIALDNQGNVFVTGTANIDYNNTVWTGDYCTIKYNSSGQQQWAKIYSGNTTGRDIPFKVAVDAQGNVLVTGQSYIDAQRNDDIVTIKYSPDGTQQWLVFHDGTAETPEQDSGRDMVLDSQGNIYIFGHSTKLVTWYDLFLIKYNSSGAVQFTRDYSGPYNNTTEYGVAITLDNSGNIYCLGELSDGTLAVLKYNSSGVQQWVYIYSSNFFNNAKDITIDPGGNVLFCGSAGAKGFITKLNTAGSLVWNNLITGTGGNEIVNKIHTDAMGDIYITGKVAAGTYFDLIAEKINPAGTTQWRASYNGTGNQNDLGNAIGMDGSGNVFVTGGTNVGGFNNMCTIKFAPGTIGINPVSNEIPNGYSLSQNYPNPFNPVTNIEFAISNSAFVKLVVYNSLGKEVETLVSEDLTPGIYKADWNASEYPSGVYFYKISAGSFTETKRMILVK